MWFASFGRVKFKLGWFRRRLLWWYVFNNRRDCLRECQWCCRNHLLTFRALFRGSLSLLERLLSSLLLSCDRPSQPLDQACRVMRNVNLGEVVRTWCTTCSFWRSGGCRGWNRTCYDVAAVLAADYVVEVLFTQILQILAACLVYLRLLYPMLLQRCNQRLKPLFLHNILLIIDLRLCFQSWLLQTSWRIKIIRFLRLLSRCEGAFLGHRELVVCIRIALVEELVPLLSHLKRLLCEMLTVKRLRKLKDKMLFFANHS